MPPPERKRYVVYINDGKLHKEGWKAAIDKEITLGAWVEEAMREKLEREGKGGKEGC